MSKMDNMSKIDYLTKRSSELLADMRRLEKENQKNKRTRDNLQKERDNNRTELSKTVGLKEKLEKLCRELQRDNNKMKVSTHPSKSCRHPTRRLGRYCENE
jgi:chromosome segregation ATPase